MEGEDSWAEVKDARRMRKAGWRERGSGPGGREGRVGGREGRAEDGGWREGRAEDWGWVGRQVVVVVSRLFHSLYLRLKDDTANISLTCTAID